MRGSNLVGVHVKEHGRMEQRTRMQQSHRVITHRNSAYARATTRSRSLLLGRHVAARKLQEGYLARLARGLVALIRSEICYRFRVNDGIRSPGPGGAILVLISSVLVQKPRRQERER